MGQDEQGYNNKLGIVDFLYLGVLLFGFSQFYALKWWPLYILFVVISYSIVLDWRSAGVMAQSGLFRYFILDIVMVFNYFGLINTMTGINNLNSSKLEFFLMHYAVVFFIYVAWNYAILFSNKNHTERTKAFLNFFNLVGTLAFALCCFCVLQYILRFSFISDTIFLILILAIGAIHLMELILWTYKTYFSKVEVE